jgi:hypothetical protein
MAISNKQLDETLKVIVGLFGAAPGKIYLDEIVEAVDQYGVRVVADGLSKHPIFKDDVLGKNSTTDERIEIVLSHFGLDANGTGSADTQAREYVEYWLENGKSWGEIVYDGVVYLSGNPAPEFADAVAYLNNAALVSKIFSQAHSSTDLDFLQSILAGVTKDGPSTQQDAEDYVDSFFPSAPREPKNFVLTAGIDRIDLHDGDVVTGDSSTFDPGDVIQGHSGTVNLFLDDKLDEAGTIDNVDVVNIDPGLTGVNDGTVVVNAQGWTNIGQVNLNKTEAPVAFFMNNIQGSTLPNILVNDLEPGASATFDFDGQDLNANNKTANIDVKEARGTLSIINDDDLSATETINLGIQDTKGFESTLEDLIGDGTKTLNISGGEVGINFKIIGSLDSGLTTINAGPDGTTLSNLFLNVSDSKEGMKITLGDGDDTLHTGDTLDPLAPNPDTIDGGLGQDLLTAAFTTAGTRHPVMTRVERAELTFGANATLDLGSTDDLETIDVNPSSHRIALIGMDSTVTTINVTGNQASNQQHSIHYDSGKNLAMNWMSEGSDDSNAGELDFDGIQNVVFTHSGPFQTFFRDIVGDGNDGIFTFDDALRSLEITNAGDGDLYLLGGNGNEAIAGTRMMQSLSINATGGDIAISGDIDTIVKLRELTLTASNGNYLALDDIGTVKDDVWGGGGLISGYGEHLDYVTINANRNSTIKIDELRADFSTISTFNVNIGNDAFVKINDIYAQDISDMTVKIGQGGDFDPTFHLTNQGDNLIVSGGGTAGPFIFTDEAFKFMNFSGLTGGGVVVNFANAEEGVEIIGTGLDDEIYSGEGSDTANLGAGNDVYWQNGGADVVTTGAGRDRVFLNNVVENVPGPDHVIKQVITDFTPGVSGDELIFDRSDLNTFNTTNNDDATQNITLYTFDGKNVLDSPNEDKVYHASGATDFAGIVNNDDYSLYILRNKTHETQGDVAASISAGGSHMIYHSGFFNQGKNKNQNSDSAYDEENDAIFVGWTDNAGSSYIGVAYTVARIENQEYNGDGITNDIAYSWQVETIVELTGVSSTQFASFGDTNWDTIA